MKNQIDEERSDSVRFFIKSANYERNISRNNSHK